LQYNTVALENYNVFKRQVYLNNDPVLLAAKLAVSGNLPELSASGAESDIERILSDTHRQTFAIDKYAHFLEDLRPLGRSCTWPITPVKLFSINYLSSVAKILSERNHKFTVVVRGARLSTTRLWKMPG